MSVIFLIRENTVLNNKKIRLYSPQ